jgi:MYXO-CTERM domain-containing protein
MKRVKWLYLCAALLAVVPGIASADVIISDSFNRNGNLNGSAPDTPQTPGDQWTAPTEPTDSSNYTTSTTSGGELSFLSSYYSTAAVPFTPTTGNVYTLSFTENAAGDSDGWIGIGFLPGTSTSIYKSGQILDNSGNPAILITGQGGIIFYINGSISETSDTANIAGTPNSVQVVLTPAAQDTVDFLVNGTNVKSYTYTSGNPTIQSVGVTADSQGGTISDFQVSTPAPEPACAAMLSVGALGLLRRRRA